MEWKKIAENKGVIVMPSEESFAEIYPFSDDYEPDYDKFKEKRLDVTRIDGIPVIFIEGGVEKLYDEYLRLMECSGKRH